MAAVFSTRYPTEVCVAVKSTCTNRIQRITEDLTWDQIDEEGQEEGWEEGQEEGREEGREEAVQNEDTDGDSELQSDQVKKPVKTRKCKKRAANQQTRAFSGQLTFPQDVWFVLSRYILPPEVVTFSLICRGANFAVNSSKFWLRLYHRHVQKTKIHLLSDCLKPDRIDCRPGLRARVVRALFQVYSPLTSRLSPISVSSDSLFSSIELQMCTSSFWKSTVSQKPKKMWMFYVKFVDKWTLQHKRSGQRALRWVKGGDFLNENSELGRTFLQVNCPHFMATPPMNGLILTSISIGISRDMRHSSVKMVYHTPRQDGRYRKADGVIVTVDPAIDFKVLPWWHPLYPHPS